MKPVYEAEVTYRENGEIKFIRQDHDSELDARLWVESQHGRRQGGVEGAITKFARRPNIQGLLPAIVHNSIWRESFGPIEGTEDHGWKQNNIHGPY